MNLFTFENGQSFYLCEGCGSPAKGFDLNDVPLCDECGHGSEKMDREGTK